eukprot:4828075-Prymnesium_polylepis.2
MAENTCFAGMRAFSTASPWHTASRCSSAVALGAAAVAAASAAAARRRARFPICSSAISPSRSARRSSGKGAAGSAASRRSTEVGGNAALAWRSAEQPSRRQKWQRRISTSSNQGPNSRVRSSAGMPRKVSPQPLRSR